MGKQRVVISWEPDSPFVLRVFKLMEKESRRRKLQDGVALSDVWMGLRRRYRDGEEIDPDDPMLRTIIRRKVSNCYRNEEGPARSRNHRISVEDLENVPQTRFATPPEDFASREARRELETALGNLKRLHLDAVQARFKISDAPSMSDLAQRSGKTVQNFYKLSDRGVQELRTLLARVP